MSLLDELRDSKSGWLVSYKLSCQAKKALQEELKKREKGIKTIKSLIYQETKKIKEAKTKIKYYDNQLKNKPNYIRRQNIKKIDKTLNYVLGE